MMSFFAKKDSEHRDSRTISAPVVLGIVTVVLVLMYSVPALFDWSSKQIVEVENDKKRLLSEAVVKTCISEETDIPDPAEERVNQVFDLYYCLNNEGNLVARIDTSSIDQNFLSALTEVYNEDPDNRPLGDEEMSSILKTLDPNCEEYKMTTLDQQNVALERFFEIDNWLSSESRVRYCDLETKEDLFLSDSNSPVDGNYDCKNIAIVMQHYYDCKYGFVPADENIVRSSQEVSDAA